MRDTRALPQRLIFTRSVSLDDHLAPGEIEIGGIATQGRNETDERLPSANAFWGAGAEEDDVRGDNLFQLRQIASVQEIEVTSD